MGHLPFWRITFAYLVFVYHLPFWRITSNYSISYIASYIFICIMLNDKTQTGMQWICLSSYFWRKFSSIIARLELPQNLPSMKNSTNNQSYSFHIIMSSVNSHSIMSQYSINLPNIMLNSIIHSYPKGYLWLHCSLWDILWVIIWIPMFTHERITWLKNKCML